MITIPAHGVCPSVHPQFSKTRKAELFSSENIVIATVGTVDLAEWIIDGTHVLSFFFPGNVKCCNTDACNGPPTLYTTTITTKQTSISSTISNDVDKFANSEKVPELATESELTSINERTTTATTTTIETDTFSIWPQGEEHRKKIGERYHYNYGQKDNADTSFYYPPYQRHPTDRIKSQGTDFAFEKEKEQFWNEEKMKVEQNEKSFSMENAAGLKILRNKGHILVPTSLFGADFKQNGYTLINVPESGSFSIEELVGIFYGNGASSSMSQLNFPQLEKAENPKFSGKEEEISLERSKQIEEGEEEKDEGLLPDKELEEPDKKLAVGKEEASQKGSANEFYPCKGLLWLWPTLWLRFAVL